MATIVEPAFKNLTRGYAICTEARSGSNFLGSILRSTGVLGNPAEYFNGLAIRRVYNQLDYPMDPERQLAAMAPLAATPNGVYGIKLFSEHFDAAKATRWAERLPGLCFIHLVRLDVLGQAISHMRAFQTWQWVAHRPARGEPSYDFAALKGEVLRLLMAQNRWRYYFARNRVPVLHLTYEDFCLTPQETAEKVARLIGLDEKPQVRLDAIKLTIQRDELNEQWRERFVAEARDLSIFD